MGLIFSCIKDMCDPVYQKQREEERAAQEEIEQERRLPRLPGGPVPLTYVRDVVFLPSGGQRTDVYKVLPDNTLILKFSY